MTTSTGGGHRSKNNKSKIETNSPKLEDTKIEVNDKPMSNSQETHNSLLKYFTEHHNVSMGVCFGGIIFFYTYYSYLQEDL